MKENYKSLQISYRHDKARRYNGGCKTSAADLITRRVQLEGVVKRQRSNRRG